MKPDAARTRFLQRLESVGLSLATLTPAVGVEAMVAYYSEERAEGCNFEGDSDMLLFEWGTYDWGSGPAFEVSITRQLDVDGDEVEELRQLRLIFRFAPQAGAAAGRGSSRWCASLAELANFRRFVAGSRALAAVGQQIPESVDLRYQRT